jgi:hypothetical protein
MMRESNILDPIQPTLSPLIWDKPEVERPELKPRVAHWITRHIYDTLERAGYSDPHEWLQLILTGSLTTYQYSSSSDCDVSLFVNSTVFPEWSRSEMIGIMIAGTDGITIPGTPYPLQAFVVAKQFKPHDLYKKGLRSGYDIIKGTWIEPPDRSHDHNVEQSENGFYVWAMQMADKMESLLRYEPDKAVMFWHQLHQRRMRDQQAGKGDFAESNVVYKFLANRGLFPRIAETSGEYIAKTAAQPGWTDMYHVSPRWNRESIMNHGLIGENMTSPYDIPGRVQQPHGNYLFDNPDDAESYIWSAHGRNGFPSELTGDWDDETGNPVGWETGEDPNGWDIYKVNTRGLPLNRDPESQLAAHEQWTPTQLRQEYQDWGLDAGRSDIDPWQQQIADVGANFGTEPRRYYIQPDIEPNRIQLHQHIPGWDINEDSQSDWWDEQVEDGRTLGPWYEMMLHRPQFPAHSKVAVWNQYDPIRPEELSSPTAIERGLSRPVSHEEFQQLANEGAQRYQQMIGQSLPATGLDQNWPSLQQHAWNQVQQPWGGATIDAHTGQPYQTNADLYALTVKEPGMEGHSIPIGSNAEQFTEAMNHARSRFDPILQRQNHALGVFRDDDKGTIDFDPTLVVDNRHDVETIGAHTRAVGGAYHFKSGDGLWPVHVPYEYD